MTNVQMAAGCALVAAFCLAVWSHIDVCRYVWNRVPSAGRSGLAFDLKDVQCLVLFIGCFFAEGGILSLAWVWWVSVR